ncbi:hypothetical protein WCLP8_3980001 [uncultured Gammaproteobacteria bacterium]
MIALTIDELGMARSVERKLEIARRLYDFAVNQHGLAPSDLLFDPLTFTVATGNEDDRKLALSTLEAIEAIAREMPDCQIVLGLSNVSFGLNPAARQVLNSVFLDHAVRRGMTGAIVHVSKIAPFHLITRTPNCSARWAFCPGASPTKTRSVFRVTWRRITAPNSSRCAHACCRVMVFSRPVTTMDRPANGRKRSPVAVSCRSMAIGIAC